MRKRPIILVCAALAGGAGCGDYLPEGPLAEHSQAIKDGDPATAAGAFGAVAILDNDGVQYCSGVLVSATCVVTAAHCVVLQDDATGEVIAELGPANMRVVAGALDATDVPVEQTYRIRKVVRHEGFPVPGTIGSVTLSRAEDIALLMLDTPVQTMSPVLRVSPDELDVLLHEGTPVVIAGYGARDENGQLSGSLYFGETPFQQRNETEFSAGAPGSPDGCAGDSGGPASILQGGEPHLLGISVRAIRSPGGPDCGEGGIYTLVPAYRSWLEENADGELPITGDEARGGCSVSGLRRASGGPRMGLLGALMVIAFRIIRRRIRRPRRRAGALG